MDTTPLAHSTCLFFFKAWHAGGISKLLPLPLPLPLPFGGRTARGGGGGSGRRAARWKERERGGLGISHRGAKLLTKKHVE